MLKSEESEGIRIFVPFMYPKKGESSPRNSQKRPHSACFLLKKGIPHSLVFWDSRIDSNILLEKLPSNLVLWSLVIAMVVQVLGKHAL